MTSFCNIYIAPDIAACICTHVNSLKHLGLLSCTNRALTKLLNVADQAWLCAGKTFCGEEHWGQYTELTNLYTARYLAMTAACPWISKPTEIPLNLVKSIYSLGGYCTIHGMQTSEDRLNLKVEIRNTYSPILKRGKHFVQISMSGDQFQHAFVMSSAADPVPEPTELEQRLLQEARGGTWRPHRMYSTEVRAVRLVHKNLMCVVCVDDKDREAYGIADLYFVSIPTQTVVHTVQIHGQVSHLHYCLSFDVGSVLICTDHQTQPLVQCFAPRPDLAVRQSPCLCPIFWEAFKGNMQPAFAKLPPPLAYKLLENEHTLAEFVIMGGSVEALRLLLDRLPLFVGPRSLTAAAKAGHLAMVKMLISMGADPKHDDGIILHHAIGLESPDIFEYLIGLGVESRTCCLLEHVTHLTSVQHVLKPLLNMTRYTCADLPLLIVWLQRGGDFSKHIRAIHSAAEEDMINERTDLDETPLMFAAASLIPANVEALLDCKADANARDTDGRSALQWLEASLRTPFRPAWFLDAFEDSYLENLPSPEEVTANAPRIRELVTRHM